MPTSDAAPGTVGVIHVDITFSLKKRRDLLQLIRKKKYPDLAHRMRPVHSDIFPGYDSIVSVDLHIFHATIGYG